MKSYLAPLGLAAVLAISPLAFAQQTPAPQTSPAGDTAQAGQPSAIERSLAGFFVSVLADDEGGMASIQNGEGQEALVVFVDPNAATEAKQSDEGLADMRVAPVSLLTLLQQWDGGIVFKSSDSEIAQAGELVPAEADFIAPAYLVLADGQETQVDAGAGPVTPILLSYQEASSMASEITAQGVQADSIEIVPVEFGSILAELNKMPVDQGYRIFTHPDVVALAQAADEEASQATPQ